MWGTFYMWQSIGFFMPVYFILEVLDKLPVRITSNVFALPPQTIL